MPAIRIFLDRMGIVNRPYTVALCSSVVQCSLTSVLPVLHGILGSGPQRKDEELLDYTVERCPEYQAEQDSFWVTNNFLVLDGNRYRDGTVMGFLLVPVFGTTVGYETDSFIVIGTIPHRRNEVVWKRWQ